MKNSLYNFFYWFLEGKYELERAHMQTNKTYAKCTKKYTTYVILRNVVSKKNRHTKKINSGKVTLTNVDETQTKADTNKK